MATEQRDFAQKCAEAFGALAREMDRAMVAIGRWLVAYNKARRIIVEHELGYGVPDWVFDVWEQQRRQFGSGNGRERGE